MNVITILCGIDAQNLPVVPRLVFFAQSLDLGPVDRRPVRHVAVSRAHALLPERFVRAVAVNDAERRLVSLGDGAVVVDEQGYC